MLVITRRVRENPQFVEGQNEIVIMDGLVRIFVTHVKGEGRAAQVRIGVECPPEMWIERGEVHKAAKGKKK